MRQIGADGKFITRDQEGNPTVPIIGAAFAIVRPGTRITKPAPHARPMAYVIHVPPAVKVEV